MPKVVSPFGELKEILPSTIVVQLPDPSEPCILETDGSRIAVGAVPK